MSQRRNYGFERRQRDTVRRTRQETKRERKASRASDGRVGPEMGEAQNTAPPPGQWEWFSPSRARVAITSTRDSPNEGPPDDWVLMTTEDGPPESPPAP